MMEFDWKKVLATVAPGLATALGGPLAGIAVGAISDALLGRPDGTEVDITAALVAGGPDALLKLKQAEQAFQVRMRELDIDVERIHQSDRASARERETKTGDKTNTILAFTVVGAFVTMVAGALLGWAQVDSALAGTLVGYLSAKAEQVLAYYFGSTKGSAEKTQLIASAGKNKP